MLSIIGFANFWIIWRSRNLDEIGVDTSKLNSLAERAFSDSATATNPRKPQLEELEMVLSEAIGQGR